MTRLLAKTAVAAFSALLPVLAATSAEAGLVRVRDNPMEGPSVFGDDLFRSVDISFMGAASTVSAGPFNLQFRDAGDRGGDWTNFLTFCLELTEALDLPKQHARIAGDVYFTDAADRDAIGILFGHFLTDGLGLRDRNSAAAMQLLIWEIVEDGAAGFDLTSGAFSVATRPVRNRADELWMAAISGAYTPRGFDVFSARGSQDLLVPTEAPVPGAIVLMLSGVAGLSAAMRKPRPQS